MPLSIAIQMDHVSTISIAGDTSFALALEAQRRGHRLYHYTPDRLAMRDGKVIARIEELSVRDVKGDHVTLGEQVRTDLSAKPIDGVHISFDVDVVDPVVLPGAGTKAFGGLSFREANASLKRLRDSDLPIVSADIVELNPLLDDAGRSVEITAHLLATFLGEEIL